MLKQTLNPITIHRTRLVQTFSQLVTIDSESRNERAIQSHLLSRLRKAGLYAVEDRTMHRTGLGAGNVYARLEGNSPLPPLFFSCHVDTVSPGQNILPVMDDDDVIRSSGHTILGADDKAGIAALLEAITLLKEADCIHRTLEFVFTVGEEVGLLGAGAFNMEQLKAEYGFVLDSAGPVGGITMSSPTLWHLDVKLMGKAAHAGLEPEKGVSAIEMAANAIARMSLGRVSEETVANIGTISGGTATNIVAEQATVTAEVRSFSLEEGELQLNAMIQAFQDEAAARNSLVQTNVQMLCQGYNLTSETLPVQMAEKAIEAIGRTPFRERSGGGSDANVFNGAGKPTVNLSVGYEQVHTTDEYMPVGELEYLVEVILWLATH